MRFIYPLLILLVFLQPSCGQTQNSLRIASYNVENLFDTIPDPTRSYNEFTPDSKLNWNTERYYKKLDDIAMVIDSMELPDIIGLIEIENENVLEDLIQKLQGKKSYSYEHFDSPDDRGIDVALMYESNRFYSIAAHPVPVEIQISDTLKVFTRDILYAALVYETTGDTLHFFINHWPSRVGGKEQTEPRRMAAAKTLRAAVEGTWSFNTQSRIIIMGDFNDEPNDRSIGFLMEAAHPSSEVSLYNTSESVQNQGLGSYNYRGKWDMLDQIIISTNLKLKKEPLQFKSSHVFERPFMMYQSDRFGKTPNRTYGGPEYYGGISDHLPVYIDITYDKPKKPAKQKKKKSN